MPQEIRYRHPPRTRGRRRGRVLPERERPDATYDEAELEELRASIDARLDRLAERFAASGILAQILAYGDAQAH